MSLSKRLKYSEGGELLGLDPGMDIIGEIEDLEFYLDQAHQALRHNEKLQQDLAVNRSVETKHSNLKFKYPRGSNLIDIDGNIGEVVEDKGDTVHYRVGHAQFEYTKNHVFPYTKRGAFELFLRWVRSI